MFIITKIVDLLVALILFSFNYLSGFKAKMIGQLEALKAGLAQEKVETKSMMIAYGDFVRGKATRKELQEAHQQFRDIIKAMGLGALLVLPFSVLTLPVLVKLAEKLGINIFPSAFSKKQVSAIKEPLSPPSNKD